VCVIGSWSERGRSRVLSIVALAERGVKRREGRAVVEMKAGEAETFGLFGF
jgi:hypothetical protein